MLLFACQKVIWPVKFVLTVSRENSNPGKSRKQPLFLCVLLLLLLSGEVLAWLSVWSEVQTCIWPS